jgi:hypothetical protein
MSDQDPEVAAIQKVISALESLDGEGQSRVIAYVLQRLGVAAPGGPGSTRVDPQLLAPIPQEAASPGPSATGVMDIRTFTAQKQPSSANEMAAVVGYYLAEVAPLADRKAEIAGADIEKYFKQAPFRLPAAARHTLTNAKNAGYLDPGTERGTFKLNPVGHNLVAHGMPGGGSTQRAAPARRMKTAKKKATRKKSTASRKTSRRKKS